MCYRFYCVKQILSTLNDVFIYFTPGGLLRKFRQYNFNGRNNFEYEKEIINVKLQ